MKALKSPGMLVAALASLVTIAIAAPTALAQSDYPSRPVRIIVGFPPGAAGDLISRVIGGHLSQALGQQFVVENKPGASSNIATEYAARTSKDGYTLFLGTVANVVNAAVYSKLSFDFAKDFTPIALLATVPVVLIVHPSTGVDSVKELVALAKSKPGQLNYASSGVATTPHLAGALLNVKAGINLVHVPYQGSSPAVTDLLAGRTQIMFSPVSVVLPHIQAGKLKALAWAAPKRGSVLPDLPTMAEIGMPELDASIWFGLMVPAGTPKAVADKLGRTLNDLLKSEAVLNQLQKMGYVPLGGSAADFSMYIGAELKKWTAAAQAAGAKK
jgi:tripartite-type tricarboxylate transporter receptor subunit TctC